MDLKSWHGDEITLNTIAATAEAINDTTEAAVSAAKQSHWWKNQGHHLENQITSSPAEVGQQGQIVGKFGTTRRRGFYGLFLERKHMFLRPAADATFPSLPSRIRARIK